MHQVDNITELYSCTVWPPGMEMVCSPSRVLVLVLRPGLVLVMVPGAGTLNTHSSVTRMMDQGEDIERPAKARIKGCGRVCVVQTLIHVCYK